VISPGGSTGYVDLLRNNVSFRRLWAGNVVSLFGDWFNTIALYSLILKLTGSEFALGFVFITKMLPWALAAPVAGVLVDRFDRRKLMIASDLIRAVVVLGFLLIDSREQVYIIYILIGLQVVIGSVFHPARTASIPNVTRPDELLTANTLMAATWSVVLAFGAAIGGFAAEALGLDAVFLIDSGSYLVSAFFIFRTTIPQSTAAKSTAENTEADNVFKVAHADVMKGWRHIQGRPQIRRIALAKAAWALGGGASVYMLALLGDMLSPDRQAAAIGLLFAARGIGTGLGPVIGRAFFKNQRSWPVLLGVAISTSGIFYALVGSMPLTYLIAVPVMIAHAASGLNWVFSTVLLQERTKDEFRGRVFSTDWLFVMLADSVSILGASLVLESGLLELHDAVLVFGLIQVITGLIWLRTVVPGERTFIDKNKSAARQ
jgi:MFS family permease